MNLSNKGIEFLIKEEGGIRLKAYKCQAGIWTIGVGHTGKEVIPGLEISKEKALEILKTDLIKFEDVINRNVKCHIEQYQFDALVSLVFNIGCNAFIKSTLLKKINSKSNITEIEKEWKKWRMGGGKILPILVRRREREFNMYKGE